MTRIVKYGKPFLRGILFAIALLFVQALCDLNLPNLMSDIVTVGITQNGIKNPAPDAISEQSMQFMRLFMTEEQRALLDEGYTLREAGDAAPDGKAFREMYPKAEGLYIRNDISKADLESLDDVFSDTAGVLVTLVTTYGQSGESSSDAGMGSWDTSAMYETLAPALQELLRAQPDFLDSVREEADTLEQSTKKSMGIALHRSFLTELGADIDALQQRSIIYYGALMLAVALLGGGASVLVSYLSSRISSGFARDLRRAVFSKVESFSQGEFDRFSTASLITRSTNDITQLQMVLMMGIRMICYAPILAVGGVIMAIRKSFAMSWIIGAACAILLGVLCIVLAVAMPRFKAVQALIDRLNLVSRENLSGLMVIRAFGAQGHEEARFDKANRDLTETNLFINRVMVMMMPFMMLLMNGVTLLIIWTGAHHVTETGMPIGDMMAYMQYAMQVIMSFLMISMMFIFIPRAAVSAGRIADVLNTEISVRDPEKPKAFSPEKKGVVEFRHVSFRYFGAGEDALQDISFTARPGQTTALIGSTGSGKSTIASLILRFYDATEGSVLVDGVDVREVSQHALREKIGYVPQKGVLMSGTVASNIAYGTQELSETEMENIAKVAQATDFISEREGGFDSDIAQGGGNVSGGQRQRLSIARALAKHPEIFIFDDSFSALDFTTDAALRKALREHTGDSTMLVVAQRVSTIMNAEQILVLDEGRMVGCGTHKELLKTCPQYYEIASSQLSEAEMEREAGA